MNKISKYLMAFAAAAALSVGASSCQDDVDAPAVKVPVSELVPNTTIAELKTMFYNEANNYAVKIEDANDPEKRFIIHGWVSSSDEDGNIFKSLVIQDETAALAFSIDSYNLYQRYRFGQEIIMDVTGMEFGKYAGLLQMGRKSFYEAGNTDQVSFMAPETFSTKAQLNGLPDAAKVDTVVVNTIGEIGQKTEDLIYWQSRLVRINGVTFDDAGQKYLSVWHDNSNEAQNRTITDRNGGTMIVRTSGYSTFFNQLCPEGQVDLVGILGYFNGVYRLMLIDGEGIIRAGDRPGSEDKPYTVEQAIEEEAKGITANGWVSGYIVGAVAPGLEITDVISSNADIEFDAPTVTSQTLVIASDPTIEDYTKCIVVPLAAGSEFQKKGNLADNPENLGVAIKVKGDLAKAYGTWGITGNSGKSTEFWIEGVSADEPTKGPAGSGTEADPYNVAMALKVIA